VRNGKGKESGTGRRSNGPTELDPERSSHSLRKKAHGVFFARTPHWAACSLHGSGSIIGRRPLGMVWHMELWRSQCCFTRKPFQEGTACLLANSPDAC